MGDLLGNGSFRWLWSGQCLSTIADWTFRTALLIWIYTLTHSGAAVSLMGLCETLPLLVVAPIAGVYVDRWDRLRTMSGALLARALFLVPLFWVHDASGVALICGVTVLLSAASQFFGPAAMAVLPNVVTEQQLGSANSLMQLIQSIVGIVAPAAGAALLAILGVPVTLAIMIGLYVAAAAILLGVRLPGGAPSAAGDVHEPLLVAMRAGFHALAGSRQMLALVAIALVAMLGVGGLSVLDVVFVTRALHQQPSTMGILLSANGAGAAVGGVVIAVLSSRRTLPYSRILSWSILAIGAGILAYAAAPTLLLAAAALVAVGLCFPPLMVAFTTMIQLAVADAYRGRVMSLFTTATAVVTILSISVVGVITDRVDVRQVIAGGGAVLIAAGLLALAILRPVPAPAQPAAAEPAEPLQSGTGAPL